MFLIWNKNTGDYHPDLSVPLRSAVYSFSPLRLFPGCSLQKHEEAPGEALDLRSGAFIPSSKGDVEHLDSVRRREDQTMAGSPDRSSLTTDMNLSKPV